MEVLIPFSSLPSFSRNSLVIGKRRNAASTSTRSCHISKAWSQITTGRRSCRSDGVLPWTGWDGTGPKASARTQRLSSRVLESLRHFSLYFSRQWIPGIKREVHHLLTISFWQKKKKSRFPINSWSEIALFTLSVIIAGTAGFGSAV